MYRDGTGLLVMTAAYIEMSFHYTQQKEKLRGHEGI
jgi:hypothetical protein